MRTQRQGAGRGCGPSLGRDLDARGSGPRVRRRGVARFPTSAADPRIVLLTLLTAGRRVLLGDRAGRGVSALLSLSRPVVRASPPEGEDTLF